MNTRITMFPMRYIHAIKTQNEWITMESPFTKPYLVWYVENNVWYPQVVYYYLL